MKTIARLICSIALCLLAGLLGSFVTADSVSTWYAELSRPSFTPPGWAFGVVWPILYVMMGISAFLVWNAGIAKKQVKTALAIFAVHLLLNALWTPIFFGLHMLLLALVEIILLWLALLTTIFYFRKISKPAALLLVPYILWLTFAVTLNAAFYLLNK
jgi:tryptophan-rich sensory protein